MRPNVLLITLDQMRWDAIGAHGNSLIATPHLDGLVDGGVTFGRAYTPSPVCVPARAAILTGQLPHNNGVYDNTTPLTDGYPTFVRELAACGYRTQAVGKMHFDPVRASHGFQHHLLSEEIPATVEEEDYLTALQAAGYAHVEEPHGIRHELYYLPQPSQLPEDRHTTAWTGRTTCDWLSQRGDDETPFFCWTSFIKPHPPFDPPAPWYRMYDPLAMPDPIRSPEELNALTYHQRLQHRVKWIGPDAPTLLLRTMKAYYYASISFVDAWIGHMLDTLRTTGLADRTLVVLTSDHGEYLGDHWSFGKRGFHDAAARVPLIMSWPGTLPPATRIDALVNLCDLAPTIRDYTGTPASIATDGASLRPLIDGRVSDLRQVMVGELGRDSERVLLAMDRSHKLVSSHIDHDIRWWSYTSQDEETCFSRDLGAAPAQRLMTAIPRAEGLRQSQLDSGLVGVLDDRDPAGRGLQYARWPLHSPWCWTSDAKARVEPPPAPTSGYSGA